MPTSKEERDRILSLLEAGQVSALQAAQLLDALDVEFERPPERVRERILRIRTTHIQAGVQHIHMTASLPISLLKTCFRLGVHLLPKLGNSTLQDLLSTIENGATGRLLDLQDLERGERLEIFVE